MLSTAAALAGGDVDWAPFWTEMEEPGKRQWQALGPFFEQRWFWDAEEVEQPEEGGYTRTMGTLRPLFLDQKNDKEGTEAFYLLPPIFEYKKSRFDESWSIYDLIQWRNIHVGDDNQTRFMIFPFLFYYKMPGDPPKRTGGLFPIGGSVVNFFGYDRLSWAMFPVGVEMQKGNTIRYGYPWPFVQWQDGPGAGGWALWPLMGHFWKEHDYDSQYLFWPLIYRKVSGMRAEEPTVAQGFLPFYAFENGPGLEDVTIGWPFFGWRREAEGNYSEERYFWPLFVQGRGDRVYINRWAPFYTHSVVGLTDKTWIMWPAYRDRITYEHNLKVRRIQFFYFLYWRETQSSLSNPDLPHAEKVHLWPFLSYYDNGAGLKQSQLLSPFEVFFPHRESFRLLYTPLFALFRKQEDANTGVTEQTAFWGLFREKRTEETLEFEVGPLFKHETGPGRARFSLLRGLLGFERDGDEKKYEIFWLRF